MSEQAEKEQELVAGTIGGITLGQHSPVPAEETRALLRPYLGGKK
jgi:hypothetical protein